MKKFLLIAVLVVGGLCFSTPARAQSSHEVDLSAADTSCTSAATCTLQVYRAVGTCPTSGIGTLSYTQLAASFAGTATTTNESWTYVDTSGLASSTTYCYYVTATYSSGGAASLPSNTFQGTTPQAQPQTTPTLTGVVKK